MNCLTLNFRKTSFFEMSLTICQSAQRHSHREKVRWWNIQIIADQIPAIGATFQEELPQKWKGSTTVSIQRKDDITECTILEAHPYD